MSQSRDLEEAIYDLKEAIKESYLYSLIEKILDKIEYILRQ